MNSAQPLRYDTYGTASWLVRTSGVALAYFLTGWLGLKLPYYGSHITLLWLPTGIAVAALIRWGPAIWPGIALGAFLANWAIDSGPALALGTAVGNTLAPLLTAFGLRHSRFDRTFSHQTDVAAFIVASAAGMLVSATFGVGCLYNAGQVAPSGLTSAWLTWWVGDVVGLLLAGPLLLQLSSPRCSPLWQKKRSLFLWFLAAGCLAWLVFVAHYVGTDIRLPLAFLALSLFAWAALHFGFIAASVACLGFAMVATWSASAGLGPFHQHSSSLALILLWSYLATAQLMGLTLSAYKQELERVERSRFKSDERLRRTIESVKDYSIVTLDPEGRVSSWNEGSRRMTGHEEAEILGQPFAVFYASADQAAQKPQKFMRAALEQGQVEDESWRVRKDGSLFCAHVSLSVMRDPTGALLGFSKVTRDATDRRRAEYEMHRLNRALRLLSDSNLLLVQMKTETSLFQDLCQLLVTSGDYVMAWVGIPEYDDTKSVRPAAVAGQANGYLDNVQISWDDQSPYGLGPTGTAIRTGSPVINQNMRTNPNLRPWQEAAIKQGFQASIGLPLVGDQGVLGALTLYAVEPDAFEHAEVQLLEELARNVSFGVQSFRTRQERDSAQAATHAKSVFLANMSHEIRTPLNAILGMTYLLRRETLTPVQATRLETIHASAQHLLGVINDILDLSKIEAGKLVLDITEVAIENLLDSVFSIISPRAYAKGLVLRAQTEKVPERLVGDSTRLTQALLNYANNAVKFTEKGSITLRIRVQERTGTSLLLRFEVEDTGMGITPEALERLFTPFEQADNSTTRAYGGTGLGLSITKNLAALMGGEAGATSTPEVGSVFWFTARLEVGEARPLGHSAVELADAEKQLSMHCAGKSILLVEDELINQSVITELLSEEPLSIDTADNGVQAVEKVLSKDYDLILMDMQMPRMDGVTATREIRKMTGREKVPIIALTANAFSEDRARCLAAGMSDFLAKPVEPEKFYSMLLRWLKSC